MNIFVLDKDPVVAAQMQCDKHIVKMVLESAQMLSTAHRLLDGEMVVGTSKTGRKSKSWVLSDPVMEASLYKAVHMGHPCTVWTMESNNNYTWHYVHFQALAEEFEYRYGKQHKSWVDLKELLKSPPRSIPVHYLTPFKLAMGASPECINEKDPVGSYRSFYKTKQKRFEMKWTKRSTPAWFSEMELV